MKNEAFIDGQKQAQRHLREVVVVTTSQWWTERMNAYANGRWSSKKAQEHFCKGWQSVAHPSFVEDREVKLVVCLMNVSPEKDGVLSPLEKAMYATFHAHSSMSKITFLEETKICLKYEIVTTIEWLNMLPIVEFLKQQLVSYKVQVKEPVVNQ